MRPQWIQLSVPSFRICTSATTMLWLNPVALLWPYFGGQVGSICHVDHSYSLKTLGCSFLHTHCPNFCFFFSASVWSPPRRYISKRLLFLMFSHLLFVISTLCFLPMLFCYSCNLNNHLPRKSPKFTSTSDSHLIAVCGVSQGTHIDLAFNLL